MVVREGEVGKWRCEENQVAVEDTPNSSDEECMEQTYGHADYEMAEQQDIGEDDEDVDDASGSGRSGS